MSYRSFSLACRCGQAPSRIEEIGVSDEHELVIHWWCDECQKVVYAVKSLSDCWRECPSKDETLLAAVSEAGSETQAEDLLFLSRMGISYLDDRES